MKLVVGLGNPGRKYEATRHNVGFRVIEELARRHGSGKARARFRGEVVEAMLGGSRALLLQPQTYMNRSGASVLAARDFYKIENEDLLVVCDDFNLFLARLRFRPKGSSGGQKGLADIIRCLGSDSFSRLRIGIGPPPEQWDVADFVLSKFINKELKSVEAAITRASDAVVTWSNDGIGACMNQYNTREPAT